MSQCSRRRCRPLLLNPARESILPLLVAPASRRDAQGQRTIPILQWRRWPLQFQILAGRRDSRRVVNQTVGPGTRLPRPAIDSSSLECPVVSARSSCHRGDLDVQLPVFPSTWALSVVSAVISGLCFNRSASSHAEGWLCGTFRHCLLLRFQLRFLALFTPAEAVNSLGYNCTSITCVGEGACGPTSSLFLHGMPPGLFRPT